MISIENRETERLTNIGSKNFLEGIWSPDGSLIAFYTDENNLLLLRMDELLVTDLVETRSSTYDISWSPDSSKILFRARDNHDYELYLVDVNTGKIDQISENEVDEYYPDWSPNGEFILFLSNKNFDSPILNIFIADVNGLNRKQITFEQYGVDNPAWLP